MYAVYILNGKIELDPLPSVHFLSWQHITELSLDCESVKPQTREIAIISGYINLSQIAFSFELLIT